MQDKQKQKILTFENLEPSNVWQFSLKNNNDHFPIHFPWLTDLITCWFLLFSTTAAVLV